MPDVRDIRATYDPDAKVWWAKSDDLPGLVSEATTLDELRDRATEAARDLLETDEGVHGQVILCFTHQTSLLLA